MQGNVKWFNTKKGYGFITAENGTDYFVHYSAIQQEGYKSLKDGALVEFTPESSERGQMAKNVVAI